MNDTSDVNDQTNRPTSRNTDGVTEAFPRHLPPVDERTTAPPTGDSDDQTQVSDDTANTPAPQPPTPNDTGIQTADGQSLRQEDLPKVQIAYKDDDVSKPSKDGTPIMPVGKVADNDDDAAADTNTSGAPSAKESLLSSIKMMGSRQSPDTTSTADVTNSPDSASSPITTAPPDTSPDTSPDTADSPNIESSSPTDNTPDSPNTSPQPPASQSLPTPPVPSTPPSTPPSTSPSTPPSSPRSAPPPGEPGAPPSPPGAPPSPPGKPPSSNQPHPPVPPSASPASASPISPSGAPPSPPGGPTTPPTPPSSPPTPPKSGRKLFGIDMKAVGAAAALVIFLVVGLAGVMIALRQRTTEPIAPTAPTSTPTATSPVHNACTLTFTVAAGEFTPSCDLTTYRNDQSNTAGNYTLNQTATTYNQSGIIVYAVDITNDGSSASNYQLVDVIDEPGLTFMDSNCGADAFDSTTNTLTCNTTDLGGAVAPGDTTQVVYRLQVAPDAPVGQIDNSVDVRSTRDSSQATSCSAPVTIQSLSQPAEVDLTVTKDDGTTTYSQGGGSTYTITVGNNGPDTATGATLTDTFPASITVADWICNSTQGASCGADTGGGNINETINVGPNETVTYTVDVKYSGTATGSITNTAEVIAASGTTDTDTSNNIDSDTNNQADSTGPETDLRISKDDGTDIYSPGEANTYTITVRNDGPDDVTAARVTDAFPAEISSVVVECSAGSGASCPAGPHNDDIDDTVDIPDGSQVTYTVRATYSNSASGDVTNTARVSVPSGVVDPDTSNNADSDTNSQPGDTTTTTTTTTTIAQAGAACNQACSANADCADDSHVCFNGQCRSAAFPDSTTCTAPAAQGDQPALPEQLPQTGADDLAVWLRIGLGVLSAGAILLFLL